MGTSIADLYAARLFSTENSNLTREIASEMSIFQYKFDVSLTDSRVRFEIVNYRIAGLARFLVVAMNYYIQTYISSRHVPRGVGRMNRALLLPTLILTLHTSFTSSTFNSAFIHLRR